MEKPFYSGNVEELIDAIERLYGRGSLLEALERAYLFGFHERNASMDHALTSYFGCHYFKMSGIDAFTTKLNLSELDGRKVVIIDSNGNPSFGRFDLQIPASPSASLEDLKWASRLMGAMHGKDGNELYVSGVAPAVWDSADTLDIETIFDGIAPSGDTVRFVRIHDSLCHGESGERVVGVTTGDSYRAKDIKVLRIISGGEKEVVTCEQRD